MRYPVLRFQMMKGILFLVLAATSLSLAALTNDETIVKYANAITANALREHVYKLSSDEMEGRSTAFKGQKLAAKYIEDQLGRTGVPPGVNGRYQQMFPVYTDDNVKSHLEINGRSFAVNEDFRPYHELIYFLPFEASQNFSEAVLVGHGIEDSSFNDYSGLDVTGKLLLVLEGSPSTYESTKQEHDSPASTPVKITNAISKGAGAILMVTTDVRQHSTTQNSTTRYFTNYVRRQYPNVFAVSANVAESIVGADKWRELQASSKAEQIKPQVFKRDIHLAFSKERKNLGSSNVVGYIEGSDKKDEQVIITAHYDHLGRIGSKIFPGADDNASGTAALLELAKAFVKAKVDGNGPRRSILLIAFSGEEQAASGSAYYVENPLYPLEKAAVNLNIDMIGRIGTEYLEDVNSENYIYVIADDKLSPDLDEITNQANRHTGLKLDRKCNDPANPCHEYSDASDHGRFARKGVPAVFYFGGMHADYHSPTDTPGKINYELLEKRARLVFFTAWEMANREGALKRDRPVSEKH